MQMVYQHVVKLSTSHVRNPSWSWCPGKYLWPRPRSLRKLWRSCPSIYTHRPPRPRPPLLRPPLPGPPRPIGPLTWDGCRDHGYLWTRISVRGPGTKMISVMGRALGPKSCNQLIWPKFNSYPCNLGPTMLEVSLSKPITAKSTWELATAAKARSLWRESPEKDQVNRFRLMWMRCDAFWDCNTIALWNCLGFLPHPMASWTSFWNIARWELCGTTWRKLKSFRAAN